MTAAALAQNAIDDRELTRVGLKAFFNIAHKWNLRAGEQQVLLGSPSRPTMARWRAWSQTGKGHCPNAVSRDVLERLSYVMGIYKALQILFSTVDIQDNWIRRENDAPGFGGRAPIDRMLAGNVTDLADVRRYLDSIRS